MANPYDKELITALKVGVLGGGQLGKMLCTAAAPFGLRMFILDPDEACASRFHCEGFVKGDFKDYDAVLEFGKDKDVITVEIEHVNIRALRALKDRGVVVHPDPEILAMIQDKGLQKQFYSQHQIPTADYMLFDDTAALIAALEDGRLKFPFVQKSRTAGYDGKGVAVIRHRDDMNKLLSGPSVAEEMIHFTKEIAVIAARNSVGEIVTFPAVDMDFNPEANLVEFLVCPSLQKPEVIAKADELARQVIGKMGICGLLAVEMFVTDGDEVFVNEVAPRPHNSGHHTIEACVTSQYEMHLRTILGYPAGSTGLLSPAVMINLLGESGYSGDARYEGIAEAMRISGVKIHLYGKKQTRPFRKMGHVTILGSTPQEAMQKAQLVKGTLKVKAL